MDGTTLAVMDAAMDIAMQAELDAAVDTVNQAAHVEVMDHDVDAVVEAFCGAQGLVVPAMMAHSALDTKTRDDGAPMTQEPIE